MFCVGTGTWDFVEVGCWGAAGGGVGTSHCRKLVLGCRGGKAPARLIVESWYWGAMADLGLGEIH